MLIRVITACIAIPLFLTLVYLGGLFLQIGIAILVIVGLYEFSCLYSTDAFWDYLLLAGLSLLYLTYTGLYDSLLPVWFILQLFYLLIRATFSDSCPLKQSWQMVAVFYVAGLLSFLWLIISDFGFCWALFALFITWATDIGAYFTGLGFGKHKLAVKISPNKTIEGSLGGIIVALVVGYIFTYFTEIPVYVAVLLATGLSVTAQIGDLVESAIKREKDVKDSGSVLPGHGGILDRFDSLLFVMPIIYFLLKYTNIS